MTVRAQISTSTGSNTAVLAAGHLPLPGLTLASHAEEGAVALSSVSLDDPAGTLDLTGWARWDVYELSAASNDRIIWSGYAADRTVRRGGYRTGSGRVWDVNLADANTVLGLRVLTDDAAERPAETDVDRVTWLTTTAAFAVIGDTTYVSTANPVDMDAADYRGQYVTDILRDCSVQSGKNWFVYNAEPDPRLGLFYDVAASSNFSSSLRLTNDATAVDEITTFYVKADDAEVNIDPSRVYSGVVIPYDGGMIHAEDSDTRAAFVWRDAVMPAHNVTSAETATARGERILRDVATEQQRLRLTTILPADGINDLRAGHRIRVKFSWMPDLTDWTYARVLTRTIRQLSDDEYEVTIEASIPPPEPVAQAVYGILYKPHGPYDDIVHWEEPGDTPPPGQEYRPTVGPISVLTDPAPDNPRYSRTGWQINGTGTIDVNAFVTTIGVLGSGTVRCAIERNGTAVAVQSTSWSGFIEGYGEDIRLSASGVAVVPGDEITVRLTCSPAGGIYFFRTPRGVGQLTEQLEISGGSLA